MEKIKIKISKDTSNYIEGLFIQSDYLKSLLFLLMTNDNTEQKDIDYYLLKTYSAVLELEIAKDKLANQYAPENYQNFYMDFENNQIIFIKEGNNCATQK